MLSRRKNNNAIFRHEIRQEPAQQKIIMDEHEIYNKYDNLLLSWTRNRGLMKKEITG